jgi:DNA replication protein DnaC
MANYERLIVDELGFVPISKTGEELLFEIFSQRYKRESRCKLTGGLLRCGKCGRKLHVR